MASGDGIIDKIQEDIAEILTLLDTVITGNEMQVDIVSGGSGAANLTYGTPSQASVTDTAANIVAATTGYREVTIFVDNGALGGIYVNANGTATTSHFLIPPGGHMKFETANAISAIRAGAANVTVYIQTAT